MLGIDLEGAGVEGGDALVAADVDEGVGGHVDQVAGRRRQGGEPLGIGQRQRRPVRSLGGMDVVVDGAGVVGPRLQDRLDDGHGL